MKIKQQQIDWKNAEKLMFEMNFQRKQLEIELRYDDPTKNENYYLFGIKRQFILIKTSVLELFKLNEAMQLTMINRNSSMTLYVEDKDVEKEVYKALHNKELWQENELYYEVLLKLIELMEK